MNKIDKRKKYFIILDFDKNKLGYIVADKKGFVYKQGNNEKTLEKDIKNYNIKKIYAFNYAYDKRLIESDFIKSLVWCDVWNICCQTLGTQKNFYKFCKKYHCYTSNGNIKTNLETFCRYINNDISIKQKHKAVSDCLMTLNVLIRSLNQHKKISKENHNFWLDVNYNYKRWCVNKC